MNDTRKMMLKKLLDPLRVDAGGAVPANIPSMESGVVEMPSEADVEKLRWIVSRISAWPYRLKVEWNGSMVKLHVLNDTLDSDDGRFTTIHQVTALPFHFIHWDEDRVVAFVWDMVKQRALHEVCEFFRFDGKVLHHPHRK